MNSNVRSTSCFWRLSPHKATARKKKMGFRRRGGYWQSELVVVVVEVPHLPLLQVMLSAHSPNEQSSPSFLRVLHFLSCKSQ